MAAETPHDTLEYEVWMLRATQEQIAAWDRTQFKKKSDANLLAYCAVVESCLVHARGLLEFFHNEPNPEFPGDLRPESLLPAGVDWPRKRMSRRVRKLHGEISKRVQHITASRIGPIHNWSLRELREHIDGLVSRFNGLGPVGGVIRGDRHPGLKKKGAR